jgi:hypothetical protein
MSESVNIQTDRVERKRLKRELKEEKKEKSQFLKEQRKRKCEESISKANELKAIIEKEKEKETALYFHLTSRLHKIVSDEKNQNKTKETYKEINDIMYGNANHTGLVYMGMIIRMVATKEEFEKYLALSQIHRIIFTRDQIMKMCVNFSETNIEQLRQKIRDMLSSIKLSDDVNGILTFVIESQEGDKCGYVSGYFKNGNLYVGQINLHNYVQIDGFFVDNMLEGYCKIEDHRNDFLVNKEN